MSNTIRLTPAQARANAESRVRDVIRDAKDQFGFNEPVEIVWRNLGRTAGWARMEMVSNKYSITLNEQLLTRQDWYNDLLVDTIPHEIAHLVCYWKPSLGRNHDRGWQRVCQRLGGSGGRCHSLNLERARRSRQAIYNVAGIEVRLGLTRHKRLQSGATQYRYKLGGEVYAIKRDDFTGKIVES